MRQWFAFKAAAKKEEAEIDIFGTIGSWWDGMSVQDFQRRLNQLSAKTLKLYIHSPGGYITEGHAISNMIARYKEKHGARVITVNMGLVASAATEIFMAGDDRLTYENAFFMIHNGWGMTIGDYRDHLKQAELLQKMNDSYVVAMSKSGKSADELRQLMDEETWYLGSETVDEGFATELIKGQPEDNQAKFAACAGSECMSRYRHAPQQLLNLVSHAGDASPTSNHKESDEMDEKEIKALIGGELTAFRNEFSDFLAGMKQQHAEMGAQLKASTDALQSMKAQHDALQAKVDADAAAEQARVDAITGLFAMFETEADRPYREHYLALQAEMLADKSQQEAAVRGRLAALRQQISVGKAQLPVGGTTHFDPPEQAAEGFMDKVVAYMEKHKCSKGRAIEACALAHQELHQAWLKAGGK